MKSNGPAWQLLACLGLILSLSQTQVLDAAEQKQKPFRLDPANLFVYRDSTGKIKPIRSSQQWPNRRAQILADMQTVMGPLPGAEKRVPLEMAVEEETDRGSYIRLLISYTSEPDCRTPAYLLIPKKALTSGKEYPAVLCLHPTDNKIGHQVVVGLGGRANRNYAEELAERGFVTLAPSYPLLANYQPDLESLGYQSGTMKAIWDNIRALDLLESLAFVRKGKFGVIGHSLGGHNALFTAVFEPRLQVVVSSCGFDSFRDYMDGNIKGWTSQRFMPNLLDYSLAEIPFDFHEVLASLAPRTCFISAPFYDDNFKWRSVWKIEEAVAPLYGLFDRADQFQVEYPICGHDFPEEIRNKAYEIFERELK